MNEIDKEYGVLVESLKTRVKESRYRATLSVNKELVLLYHHIGKQILKNNWKIMEQDIEFLRVQNEYLKELLAVTSNELTLIKDENKQLRKIIYENENRKQ